MADFETLRKENPEFLYESFSVIRRDGEIELSFRFSMGDTVFTPTTRIKTDNLKIVNGFNSDTARKIVFCLGMVEAVSYWKAACPPTVRVKCARLDGEDILWFKKLWFSGLGEFFHRNGISADFDSFVNIVCEGDELPKSNSFCSSGINIIPVGGGKDSAVTAELTATFRDKNMFFTVNDQPARTDCVLAAGYGEDKIIKTYRTIDPNLLELNRRGYLNGHTPFSAIVAFLSCYCAYIIGAENIILSNESSANEANIGGTNINHQYSKSYEFEKDFQGFCKKNFGGDINYFSLLRPFNEAQIAKMFAAYPQYLGVFRSCNAGSKKNVWCCKCAKCLFVFIMLSPFVERSRLIKAFGADLLDNRELLSDFEGLCGFSGVKPFECVGTSREVCAMLELTLESFGEKEKPFLLAQYEKRRHSVSHEEIKRLFGEYNNVNGVGEKFMSAVREMYKYVSSID